MEYYLILDIPQDASLEQIKRAYRKKALLYHPDRNLKNESPEDYEFKFKKVSEAYQILSDPVAREKYDTFNFIPSPEQQFDCPFEIFEKIFTKIPPEYIYLSSKLINSLIRPEKDLMMSILESVPKESKLYHIIHNLNKIIEEKYSSAQSNNSSQKEQTNETQSKVPLGEETVSETLSEEDSCLPGKDTSSKIEDSPKYFQTQNITTTIYVSLEDIYRREIKKIDINRIRKQGRQYLKEKKTFLIPLSESKVTYYQEADELPDYQQAGNVIINIDNQPHSTFKRHQHHDLLMDVNVSLYEFFYGTVISFQFLNGKMITVHSGKNIYQKRLKKISGLGLPFDENKYGNLYLRFNLQVSNVNLEDSYFKKMIFQKFPPVNHPNQPNNNCSHEQYLLETETFDSQDNL